ncbi:hypothetical protein [Diaphorobacter aerolatus]|uniref:hypothetical protein n=1 Tax=Diaphorobacter aerolatus TaxID=1288495 RepID=UPI001D00D292|nr:hypothetical protein [Diaphorobacter aerolatus]
MRMKRGRSSVGMAIAATLMVGGCAVQQAPIATKDSAHTAATQREAQAQVLKQTPAAPVLKRKVALGRISNETTYGQSLLRDKSGIRWANRSPIYSARH